MSLIDIQNRSRIMNSISNGTYLLLSKFFSPIDERNFILDPLTCIIRLCILAFKPDGTKISIFQNKISYHEPSFLQGTIRWGNGDNRNDLHNLHNPIIKATQWYDSNNEIINEIFKYACVGLSKLKNSYNKNSIICHSIDRYIDILSKIKKEDENLDENEEDNELYKSLKNLWNENQISIIYNLLNEATKVNLNMESKDAFLNAIDNIVLLKEKEVGELIKKYSTIL